VALPRHHIAYVLGPERSGLSPATLARCSHVVRIPTRFALNLAVAGALVLYDRLLQQGRFAERPVGSLAASEVAPKPHHGAPRFRRNIPDWLAEQQTAAGKKT
jgi:tRNA C32,U32 (ribose-2'-O)-methylase TrmJ